jgi:hypothetical protein
MNVRKAAQLLSKSVAMALNTTGNFPKQNINSKFGKSALLAPMSLGAVHKLRRSFFDVF